MAYYVINGINTPIVRMDGVEFSLGIGNEIVVVNRDKQLSNRRLRGFVCGGRLG
jgi:hypothetical protein